MMDASAVFRRGRPKALYVARSIPTSYSCLHNYSSHKTALQTPELTGASTRFAPGEGVLFVPRRADATERHAVVVVPILPSCKVALPMPPQAIEGTSAVFGFETCNASLTRKAAVDRACALGRRCFGGGVAPVPIFVEELAEQTYGYTTAKVVLLAGDVAAAAVLFYSLEAMAMSPVYLFGALALTSLATMRERSRERRAEPRPAEKLAVADDRGWQEMVARDAVINSQLEEAFRAVLETDPDYDFFIGCADRINTVDTPSWASVTMMLQGPTPNLPRDTAFQPFTNVYVPPHTRPPDYIEAPQAWPLSFRPTRWQDLYFVWAAERLMRWFAVELHNLNLIFELGHKAKGKLWYQTALVLEQEKAQPLEARERFADLRHHTPGEDIPLMDFSEVPCTALNRAAVADLYAHWPDQVTVQAVVRGVTFRADDLWRRGCTVCCPHMASLKVGVAKVEAERVRWASSEVGYALITSQPATVPFHLTSTGAVVRKFELDRPRPLLNKSAPYPPSESYRIEGPPVNSLNVAIGIQAAQPTSAEGGAPIPLASTPANDLEEGEEIVVNGVQARSIGARKWAKQKMPNAQTRLMDVAVLASAIQAGFDGPLVCFGDDFKDAYLNLGLHTSQLMFTSLLWRSVDVQKFAKENPAFMCDLRMAFGISASGLIMQGLDCIIINWFYKLFDEEMEPEFEELMRRLPRDHPQVLWIRARRALSAKTGRNECRLATIDLYTDDLFLVACSIRVQMIGMRCWRRVVVTLNIKMAIAKKRNAGTAMGWNGLDYFLTALLLSIPPDKRLRALDTLRRIVRRSPTLPLAVRQKFEAVRFEEFRSTMGLLEHAFPYTPSQRDAFYHMYGDIFRAGIANGSKSYIKETVELCEQSERWITLLETSAGCYAAEAHAKFDPVERPRTVGSHFFSWDASMEGAPVPSLGGYMHGYWFSYPLTQRDIDTFHITGLEFAAGMVSVVAFVPMLEGLPAVGRGDAKVVMDILENVSASADIMQFCHLWLLKRPELQMPSSLDWEHVNGEVNVPADAASRGLFDELNRLAAHLGVHLRRLDVDKIARQVLDDMYAFVVTRPDPDKPNFGSAFRGDPTGDGPGIAPLPPPPPRQIMRRPAALRPLALRPSVATRPRQRDAPLRLLGRPETDRRAPTKIARLQHRRESRDGGKRPGALSLPPLIVMPSISAPPLPPLPPPLLFLPPLDPPKDLLPLGGRKRGLWDQTQHHDRRVRARTASDVPHAWDQRDRDHMRLQPLSLGSAASFGEWALQAHERYRLRPADPVLAAALEVRVEQAANAGKSKGALQKERKSWSLWCTYCSEVWGTVPERLNRHAHAGLDVAGQLDEEKLLTSFLPWLIGKVRPRSKKDKAAKPKSLYAHVLAVRAIHRRRFKIDMVRPINIGQVLKSIVVQFCKLYGPEALIPRRKEPATVALLSKILAIPDATRLGQTALYWNSALGVSLRAMLCTAFSGGFRKSELALPAGAEFDRMRIRRSSLKWRINGILISSPTLDQLNSLSAGDYAIIIPPPSKADPFGVFFGGRPIYFPFVANSSINAAAALAQLERTLPVAPELRSTTPLFVMGSTMQPMTASRADTLLAHLVRLVVPENQRNFYSWHSFRIGLACALLAQGAAPEMIQALCRWKSKESLIVYARLNPESYGAWVLKAQTADITSINSTNLPQFDDDVCTSVLQQLADWEGLDD
jgi:hypothetical protein